VGSDFAIASAVVDDVVVVVVAFASNDCLLEPCFFPICCDSFLSKSPSIHALLVIYAYFTVPVEAIAAFAFEFSLWWRCRHYFSTPMVFE
jgi:hypothetical protein